MSNQHRCPFCGSDGIRVNGIRNVLGNPVRVHGWCGACTSAGPIRDTEEEALGAFCNPAHAPGADDLAAARAEIERLKEDHRACEHYVMTGRNEQHEKLVARVRELEARPPIDRERLVEAFWTAWGSTPDGDFDAHDLIGEILRHLGATCK